ncbi:hypothetical protein [Staphylococcus succinus]|uniref:hypothetical protein n=1 Tax=Staphylococcus succinus TaxID=61015 RepID=UPI000E692C98|nr:hypothetical protein [Staphylococcus succinus]RIN21890.1 hypothetical protein BU067_13375 [Staphylococcus succinus]RIN38772.1 hypothetical protein BU059_13345 [Staphylococcus succinus]
MKIKLRTYLNNFVGLLFLTYFLLLTFTNIINVKWSISYIIIIAIVYVIRDLYGHKQRSKAKD